MDERAAAALALRHHDLDAEAGQKPDRRLVDAGIEHRLGAAGEQRDAAARLRLAAHGSPAGHCRRRRARCAARDAASAPSGCKRRHALEQAGEGPAEAGEPRAPARKRAG